MFGFGDKKEEAAKIKIKKSTSELLDLEVEKKRLQADKENIQLELENLKKRMRMEIEEEKHKHNLKLESEKAVFDREKTIWEKEKQELVDRAEREKNEFEKTLRADLEIEHKETVTLLKLESQQKIKQAELDKDRAVNDLKTKHAEELAKVKSDTAEEYYSSMTEAFQDLQMNGDKNSKFVQELALKVFDKLPTARTEVGVDVSTPRLAAASGDDE